VSDSNPRLLSSLELVRIVVLVPAEPRQEEKRPRFLPDLFGGTAVYSDPGLYDVLRDSHAFRQTKA
jgi:hypothetical protein